MQLRLQSYKPEPRDGTVPMSVNAPGLLRWAKAGYGANKSSDRTMVSIIAESFGLRREVALAILAGEVEMTVDGDDVIVEWPGDDPRKTYGGDE